MPTLPTALTANIKDHRRLSREQLGSREETCGRAEHSCCIIISSSSWKIEAETAAGCSQMDYVWSVEPPKSTADCSKKSDNGGCKSRVSPKPSKTPNSILDIYTISLMAFSLFFCIIIWTFTDIWYWRVKTHNVHHIDVKIKASCVACRALFFGIVHSVTHSCVVNITVHFFFSPTAVSYLHRHLWLIADLALSNASVALQIRLIQLIWSNGSEGQRGGGGRWFGWRTGDSADTKHLLTFGQSAVE